MSVRPLHILFADDDPDDREMLCEELHKIDPSMVVECCENGQQALHCLHHTAALPDLLLIDYQMPLLTGADVLAALQPHSKYHDLLKVVWSTSNDRAYADKCISHGAHYYLPKPFDMRNLHRIACFLHSLASEKTSTDPVRTMSFYSHF